MKKFVLLLIFLTVLALGACGRAETLEQYVVQEPALTESTPSPVPMDTVPMEEAPSPTMDSEKPDLTGYDPIENVSKNASDSTVEQYDESAVAENHNADYLAYEVSVENIDEPTDPQPDVNEFAPLTNLPGTWRWDVIPAFYFTLYAGGTGSGTGGMTFEWNTVGTDVLRKAYNGEVEYMYFELDGDTLILFGDIPWDYSRYLRD